MCADIHFVPCVQLWEWLLRLYRRLWGTVVLLLHCLLYTSLPSEGLAQKEEVGAEAAEQLAEAGENMEAETEQLALACLLYTSSMGVSKSVHGGAVWYDMILEFSR